MATHFPHLATFLSAPVTTVDITILRSHLEKLLENLILEDLEAKMHCTQVRSQHIAQANMFVACQMVQQLPSKLNADLQFHSYSNHSYGDLSCTFFPSTPRIEQ